MKGARGPNITQVVKPVSKYRKHASNAFQFPLRNEAIKCFIQRLPATDVPVCSESRLIQIRQWLGEAAAAGARQLCNRSCPSKEHADTLLHEFRASAAISAP